MVGAAQQTAWTLRRLWRQFEERHYRRPSQGRLADPDRITLSADSPLPPASRSTEPRSTGFGTTLFDVAAADLPPREAASVFDVCHVGVVLRALLLVHGVLAVGMLFEAPTPAAWLAGVATGAAVAMPAVVLWLVAACGMKRTLGTLPIAGQWIAAIGLGVVSATLGALLVGPLGRELLGANPLLAPAVAGGCMAGAVFFWMRLRAQALLPAATTARLAELQSRIRPHFLFNTLNTALALVRVDPARAEGVLEDLAELFRVALGDAGDPASSVTLGEEVELARRYLAIEQIRFGDRLKVQWELDAQAAGARVPPLILQPLVENAVRHGIEPADAGGTIRVRTRVKLGRVLITIANTVGATPSRPGSGIALKNVRERLRLMHDMAGQFETRRDGDVWRVQIVVPLAS
jgi:two-component system sensor histidine kinase AlgZ